jgi:hypothetical protein
MVGLQRNNLFFVYFGLIYLFYGLSCSAAFRDSATQPDTFVLAAAAGSVLCMSVCLSAVLLHFGFHLVALI